MKIGAGKLVTVAKVTVQHKNKSLISIRNLPVSRVVDVKLKTRQTRAFFGTMYVRVGSGRCVLVLCWYIVILVNILIY